MQQLAAAQESLGSQQVEVRCEAFVKLHEEAIDLCLIVFFYPRIIVFDVALFDIHKPSSRPILLSVEK